MNEIELRPCPFCGGKATIQFSGRSFVYTGKNGEAGDIGLFYTVECNNKFCGCQIGVYEDPMMAVEAWNARKGESNGAVSCRLRNHSDMGRDTQ